MRRSRRCATSCRAARAETTLTGGGSAQGRAHRRDRRGQERSLAAAGFIRCRRHRRRCRRAGGGRPRHTRPGRGRGGVRPGGAAERRQPGPGPAGRACVRRRVVAQEIECDRPSPGRRADGRTGAAGGRRADHRARHPADRGEPPRGRLRPGRGGGRAAAGAAGAAGPGSWHVQGPGGGPDPGAGRQGRAAGDRLHRGRQFRLPRRTRPRGRGSVGRAAQARPGSARADRAGPGRARAGLSYPGPTVECDDASEGAVPCARSAISSGGWRRSRWSPRWCPRATSRGPSTSWSTGSGRAAADTVLLGATGTGKTATVAWLAERLQRPVLVMLPNKTLAAQFANELREMLPDNAVEYFVSYYDYYQPEAYVPQTDTYIEKDSSINDEVDRLRHSATNSLLTRRDTIVVASVSCIYGLGTPQEYVDRMLKLRVGGNIERDALLRKLVGMQYARNDLAFSRGTFRVRGDTIEIIPVYEELAVRIEMFGDEIERLMTLHPLTGEVISEDERAVRLPRLPLRGRPGADGPGHRRHRGRAGRAARRDGAAGQAAGSAAAAHADHLRHRDDAPGGELLGDRELLAAHRRPGGGDPAQHAARLLPRGLPAGDRRVARHRAADRRHVRGRRVPQAGAGRARVPAAERDRQPAADLGRVRRPDRADAVHVGHARARTSCSGPAGK